MYLTASRPDIMFAVCACARFQVTPKTSHLHVVKRIFRYLKGQPKLGLWYPRDSPFDLEALLDSDYAGASLDRKSTTGEYVAAANCCGQVLWIQNQMLDYGFNFMNTKIYIDNESTICIVKNPVFYSKPKHIEIRHHFIRDCYEKKLIQVIKIHTVHNVTDLLTKAFDVIRSENVEVSSDSGHSSYMLINYAFTSKVPISAFVIEQFWEILPTSKTVNSVQCTNDPHFSGKLVSVTDPKCQDTLGGGTDAQTRPKAVSKTSCDPPLSEVNTSGRGEDSIEYHDDLTYFVPPTPHASPLSGGNTPGSNEGRMELIQELMETCTSLTKRVLVLEEAKTAQNGVIARLKLRVKRLEKKRRARTPQPMKRILFKGRVETFLLTKVGLRMHPNREGIVEDKGRWCLFDYSEKVGSTAGSNKGKGVLVEKEPEKLVKVKRRDQGLAQIESDAELAQGLHEEELIEHKKKDKSKKKLLVLL
ncbi:hypothetical protein Tco_1212552 [Tanacetum coccineum]